MIRRPPRSTLFPYNDALPISCQVELEPLNSAGTSVTVPAQQPTLQLTPRSEEHTSELQSLRHLVCRLLLEKKNKHRIAQERTAQMRYGPAITQGSETPSHTHP